MRHPLFILVLLLLFSFKKASAALCVLGCPTFFSLSHSSYGCSCFFPGHLGFFHPGSSSCLAPPPAPPPSPLPLAPPPRPAPSPPLCCSSLASLSVSVRCGQTEWNSQADAGEEEGKALSSQIALRVHPPRVWAEVPFSSRFQSVWGAGDSAAWGRPFSPF